MAADGRPCTIEWWALEQQRCKALALPGPWGGTAKLALEGGPNCTLKLKFQKLVL